MLKLWQSNSKHLTKAHPFRWSWVRETLSIDRTYFSKEKGNFSLIFSKRVL